MKFAACALTWMKLSLPMRSANIVVSALCVGSLAQSNWCKFDAQISY
jgi:hypothetical protein